MTFSSNDKAIEYGNLLRKEFPHLKVNLAHPDKEIHIEIRANEAYLYDNVTKAVGGLPLGVEGTLVALVSGGIDSPVAAWMMMKRGCRILPLFVALDTFLDETTLARAERVVEILARYQPGIKLTVIHDSLPGSGKTGTGQPGIWRSIPASSASAGCTGSQPHLRTESGAKGIVTGESIGQVASQTLDNLVVLTDAASDVPVYRPLIGFDKEDTIRIAREIGTFTESISPHPDARRYLPGRRPKQNRESIREIEGKLEATGMPLPA